MPTINLYPQDTYISSDNPTTNYSSSTTLKIGNDTGTSGFNRTLLKFNLSSLPANAYVSSAVLRVYNAGGGLPNGIPVAIYPVIINWVSTEATWNKRTSALNWTFAGVSGVGSDYLTPASATINFTNAETYIEFELADLVRNWVWQYLANNGCVLARYDTTYNNNTKNIYSTEWGNVSERPVLTITYALAPNTPTITLEPTYTKGTSNTIYWSNESSSGATEYFPMGSANNSFTGSVITLAGKSHKENIVSTTTTRVDVLYNVESVVGVWLNSSKTGINYFIDVTPGTFNRRQINLMQALPNSNQAVYVEYAGDGWTPRLQETFSGLTDGQTYFWQVKAKNTSNAETKWSYYTYSTQDDKVDTLTLLSPIGNEVWNGRTTQYIRWEGIDVSSGLVDNASIYRSQDSGNTWILLADNQPNQTTITNEATTSVSKIKVFTKYLIKDVVGVWLASDPGKTGTNYYLVGAATPITNPFSQREIILGTGLPADATDVIIDYKTYGFYQWNIPDNIDSVNTRIKVTAEDNVGNTAEDESDKDFVVMTLQNRLHNIYDTSDDSYVNYLIKTFKSELGIINNNTDELRRLANISTAERADLDLHGSSVSVARKVNETDRDYRNRIIAAITSLKNTKQSIIDAVTPFCSRVPIIYEWSNWKDEVFFLDYSFLDYVDYLGGGQQYGGDPFTFEVWVQPKDKTKNTYLGIIQAIERFKPAGTLYFIRLPAIGTYYGIPLYGTVYYGS